MGKTKTPKKSKKSSPTVVMDRRRPGGERRSKKSAEGGETSAPARIVTLERRAKVQRRRQIDPTTCERDYTDAEVEFMNALDAYKRTSGRMFPTCSEILEVIRDLGYVRTDETGQPVCVEAAESTAE